MVTQVTSALIKRFGFGDVSIADYNGKGLAQIGVGNNGADTAAFHAACQDVFDAGGGIVRIPPGIFEIDSPFVSTQDIGDVDTSGILIEGCGDHVSIFKTQSGLFSWSQPTQREVAAEFRNFGIQMATNGNNGVLINVTQLVGGLASSSRCKAIQIRVGPDPSVGTTAYCDKAIDFSNTYFPLVRDCRITQPRSGVALSVTQQGTALIDVDDAYGPEIHNNKLWGAARGISHVITQNPGGEGARITMNECVHNITGIHLDGGPGREPSATVFNNHTNNTLYGVLVKNKRLVRVTENLCYNEETSDAYSDIRVENSDAVRISGNEFHFGGNTLRNHVDIDATSTNVKRIDNWHASDGTALKIASGANQVFSAFNSYNTEIDTEVNDLGGTNVRQGERAQPIDVQFSLSSAITVANEADTTVTWTVEDEDTRDIFAPGSIIQVPSGRGITRAIIQVGVIWQNSSVGDRIVRITKNNGRPNDAPDNTEGAALTSDETLDGSMAVTGGDNLRVIVRQSSGGPLDLSAIGSFVRIEFK